MLDIRLLGQVDPPSEMETGVVVGLVVAAIAFGLIIISLLVFSRYFGLWIQSQLTRADISFFNLLISVNIIKINYFKFKFKPFF